MAGPPLAVFMIARHPSAITTELEKNKGLSLQDLEITFGATQQGHRQKEYGHGLGVLLYWGQELGGPQVSQVHPLLVN